jgi:RNA polymerase sigma factor (sigma-70 family)
MRGPNPFADTPASDADDQALVRQAQAGSREALEELIRRHQAWIYNIAVRMLYWPYDAEDTTQEILIKLITKLSTFQGKSSFRTWLYRIVANHVLNQNRRGWEGRMTFESYDQYLDSTPDRDIPDATAARPDTRLIVEEAKIGCTSAMLLCLDREQRLVYILGEVFGVTDVVGAELLETSRENFRQKLTRARRDLQNYTQGRCGLVDPANPCRCAKKTAGFIKSGYLDPQNLLFARERVIAVRDVAGKACDDIGTLDDTYGEILRGHPFLEGPDLVESLRALVNRPDFKFLLEFK